MKILFLVSDLKSFGGIQQYNRQLLGVLLGEKEGVSTVQLEKGIFGKVKFAALTLFYVCRQRPDIVFCGHINFSPLLWILYKLRRQRFIVFVHGVDAWDIRGPLRRAALQCAEKVVTVSRYTAEKIIRQLPDLKDRIVLIPNSIDGEKFFIEKKPQYLMERYGTSNAKVILTVSRLSKVEAGFKGYERVVESLPHILSLVPHVKYILVGGGDDAPRIRKLAERLRLSDRVILAGAVKDEELVDHYNLADVFVMPSKCEGFGIVFLEALACGLPVVAGNLDASPETLLGGELGLLVDPDDKRAITEAVVSILNKKANSGLLDRERLRRKTLEHYGQEKFKENVRSALL